LQTNCITELLPAKALERAKYLDDYFAEHKKPVGPLHGLPISVKEHVGIKGYGLNAAFVAWWDNIAGDDALILKYLWNAGCVLYARTTQPQLLMHLETSSNLYGETVNPYNRDLTSGGSSGGEGALIALRGSCMGIGTDIGGSIRSPAANCGVYGFRPSSYRLPLVGCHASMLGQEQVIPVIGPLSTSLEGLNIFMKAIIEQKPWLKDPSMLPFPWRDYKAKTLLKSEDGKPKLKVGILWHDGVVMPHPPITRALKEIADRLKGVASVAIVDWKPYKHDLAWEIISSLYFCDGAREDVETLAESGEPWLPLSTFIAKDQAGVKDYSVTELWKLVVRRETYKAEYAEVWNNTAVEGDPETTVDVILCPAGPGPAPPLNHARYWGYTIDHQSHPLKSAY
jgi:amidase